MQLRYKMNFLRNDSMSIKEYCGKVKMLAECAGDSITGKDWCWEYWMFSAWLLRFSFNKMDYDEAYALLLTHEARLGQS